MDADPWANTPSTPKLPSSPSSPIARAVTGKTVSPDAAAPTSLASEAPLRMEAASPASSDKPKEDGLASEEDAEGTADIAAPAESAVGDAEAADEQEDDGFDDFDDFGESAPVPLAGPSSSSNTNTKGDQAQSQGGAGGDHDNDDDDDGFGDFGDFEEGDFDEPPQTQEGQVDQVSTMGGNAFRSGGGGLVDEPFQQEERWHALSLRPFPPRGELVDQLSTLLSPLYDENTRHYLTDEQPRMVGGLSQVLVAESSRDAYAQLTTAPMLKPLDWTRSRVRREHLISMGVPVNLDEVDSHRLSALPPLRITTGAAPPQARRAESLDTNSYSNGSRYTSAQKGKGRDLSPNANGAASVPNSAGAGKASGNGRYGLGSRPQFDMAKAEDFCGLEEDRLSLLPVATLRKIQAELAETSAQASTLLAWSLQLKDAQTQDSNTYNGMISELIANAAKVKSAQATGGGVFRRASTKRPQSVSGTVTPRRTGSPGMW
ncbi:hypothetical protein IAU59_001244 [Kwoniella sp. CBS 9459]